MTRIPLLGIPNELLVEIFQRIDARSLCTCREVCRTLAALIKGTPILQYQIALAVSKLIDADEHHHISLREKLRRVQRYRAAWDTISFREPRWQQVTGKQASPRLTRVHPSGVLISTTLSPSGDIHCTRFASPLEIAEQHSWTVSLRYYPGIPLDIAIDPSQDLLAVLFIDPADDSMSLSLRSLSDGKAHGLASEPSIELDAPNDLDLDYQSVLVHGNHALYLNSTRLFYTFTLLNWKTGVSIVERIEIPTEFRPHDVAAFLDDSRVILVGHDVKYLHVYNYYNAPSNTLRKLAEVVTLDIVPPGTTWPIHSISIATSALSTDASFCRLDPRQNFYVISLRVKPSGLDSKDIFIFVPRDLILACAELVNTNQHPLHFGWEEWASGVQIFERNRGRPDPSYGISGARIVLNRILKGNEMKLKFLECDIEEVDSLTCRTVGPPGIVAAGNARGSKSAVSSRIKTRTTRIQLPLPDFLVRSVSPWDFGILIETLMDSSIFVASLDGWS